MLVGLGLWVGCTSVKVVHRAPEFDSSSLASGGLGIGAVAGLGGGEYLLADNVSRLLSQELAQKYPGLTVLPLEEIKPLLPTAEYNSFVLDFSELMTVRVQHVELLSAIHPHVRYVLLVDVAQDDVQEDDSISSTTEKEWVQNCKTGEYEMVDGDTEYHRVRSRARFVEARLIICDLELRRPVWVAIGRNNGAESSGTTSIFSTPPAPAWPSAPSSLDPLAGIMAKAVRKLPK